MERALSPILKRSDYEGAPDDDQEAFVFLEDLARHRLYESASEDQNGNVYYPQMDDYMTKVAGIAAAYNIPGISFDPTQNDQRLEFSHFLNAVDFQTAQIQAMLAKNRRKTAIRLDARDRAKVHHHLGRIRELVEGSDLSEKRKAAILKRISGLEKELERQTVDARTALVVASMVLAAAANLKAIEEPLANAGSAIIELIGEARLKADESHPNQLTAPPLKLAPPPKREEVRSQTRKSLDFDDDIPF